MITLNIIGSGNVAHHLIREILSHDDLCLQQIFARNIENLPNDIPENTIICHDIKNLKPADITLISVSDSAISEVSSALSFDNNLVVHTSGTTAMEMVNPKNRRGVFYPLQTFSKHKKVNFTQIPICIEAENENDLILLQQLAKILSREVHFIDSEQRKAMHVAAVLVNNFTNHLCTIAEDICQKNQIPGKILQPLLQETIDKLTYLSPMEAQTGPAVRHDQKTIDAHIDFITNELTKKIYQLLTQSIQEYHGREL